MEPYAATRPPVSNVAKGPLNDDVVAVAAVTANVETNTN